MGIDSNLPHSRRTLLTAAAGAAAATVASAALRPLSVAAADNDGDTIQIGDTYGDVNSQTTLGNRANNGIVLWVASNDDFGHGAGTAVVGHTTTGIGVYGESKTSGIGVKAYSPSGYGVYAISDSGVSVYGGGGSDGGDGVQGVSVDGTGVSGDSQNWIGVSGHSGDFAVSSGSARETPRPV